MEFVANVRSRFAIALCGIELVLSAGLVTGQRPPSEDLAPRRIALEQIKIVEKALAGMPKGKVLYFSESFAHVPPLPAKPSIPVDSSPLLEPVAVKLAAPIEGKDEDYEEMRAFSDQLTKILQDGGYAITPPNGLSARPGKGVLIQILKHEARPMATALRDCLIASQIKNVRVSEYVPDELARAKNDPDSNVLMWILVGRNQPM